MTRRALLTISAVFAACTVATGGVFLRPEPETVGTLEHCQRVAYEMMRPGMEDDRKVSQKHPCWKYFHPFADDAAQRQDQRP